MGFKKRARRGKDSKNNREKRREGDDLDSPDRIVGYGGKEYETLGSALDKIGEDVPIGMITDVHQGLSDNYVGTQKNGIPHGQGRLTKGNGDVIEGIWKEGVMHGQCRYEFANGEVHDGEWVDGLIVFGTVTSPGDGEHYVGQLKSDPMSGTLKHGKGVYHFANGMRYEGEFKEDHPHGAGVHYDENGKEMLRGTWRMGEYIG